MRESARWKSSRMRALLHSRRVCVRVYVFLSARATKLITFWYCVCERESEGGGPRFRQRGKSDSLPVLYERHIFWKLILVALGNSFPLAWKIVNTLCTAVHISFCDSLPHISDTEIKLARSLNFLANGTVFWYLYWNWFHFKDIFSKMYDLKKFIDLKGRVQFPILIILSTGLLLFKSNFFHRDCF